MPGIGYVSLNQLNVQLPTFSFDESVCGMLFDYSQFESPFESFILLEQHFNNDQVQLIHNLQEAEEMGLSSEFMNGVPYYHIKTFYDYIGGDAALYLMFADCSGFNFEAIQTIQCLANGRIFQLGVWTEQFLWRIGEDGNYAFTELLGNIEAQAEILSGAVGKSFCENLPLSIIVNACTSFVKNSDDGNVDYNQLPEALSLDFPKVSVILGQNGSDEVHAIQKQNHNYTPVGFLGHAIACLYLAPAETSLGSVEQFDLNKNDSVLEPELGFGRVGSDYYTPITDINNFRRNILSAKGYIIPTTYNAKEAGVFFSNDQTLSEHDFSSISINRIAHKCRRVIRSVMFPYINNNIEIDRTNGHVSTIQGARIADEIAISIDSIMVNKVGQNQISGRYITVDDQNSILETDELYINCLFVPVISTSAIEEREAYILNEQSL